MRIDRRSAAAGVALMVIGVAGTLAVLPVALLLASVATSFTGAALFIRGVLT